MIVGGTIAGLIVVGVGWFFLRSGPEVFAGTRSQILGAPYRVTKLDIWSCRFFGLVFIVAGAVTAVGAQLGKLPADGMKH